MQLKDYPTIRGKYNKLDILARERGAALSLATKHLRKFAKFKESGWRPGASVLVAASIYCRLKGLPCRFAIEQILTQLYEQKALAECHPYPPHTNPTRSFFSIFPFQSSPRPPPVAVVGA